MTGAAPVVSVIMPAYNGAALIGETLASVAAQSFPDFEVVVVDDCSTDATREVVRAFPDTRIRLIEAPRNAGPVHARNLALSHARGRYIAGLDQDDLCHADRFARQVDVLDRRPATVLVATAARTLTGGVVAPSQMPAHTTPALIAWFINLLNPIVWSSVMIRGDAARGLEPFERADRLYAEDFDLYHRLSALGDLERIDDELVTYRCHAGGVSKRYAATMFASARAVLAQAYDPVLGDAAEAAAALVVRHVVAADPVADRATLRQLGEVLVRLQRHHLAATRPNAEDEKLIKWQTARLWWRIGRHSVRSGTLGITDALSVRPDHLGLGHAGIDDLIVSGIVGRLRARRGHSAALR